LTFCIYPDKEKTTKLANRKKRAGETNDKNEERRRRRRRNTSMQKLEVCSRQIRTP
jgi:hypothetical protein